MLNTSFHFLPKKRLSWGFLILWLSVIILLASYLVRHFPEVFINQSEHIHVISVGVLFAYLILVFIAQYFRFSETIKYLILWLGIILVILGIYRYQYQLAKVWNTIGEGFFTFKSPEMQAESMKFPSNSKGHYIIEAIVEGVPIKFKLDTGATLVVLSQMDAGRLGLMVNELAYTHPTNTSNGLVWSAPIRLQKIKIGVVSVSNISASVSKDDLEYSLLGMSFLKKIKQFGIHKGVLVLKN